MTVLLSKVSTPGWTFLMFTLNNTVQFTYWRFLQMDRWICSGSLNSGSSPGMSIVLTQIRIIIFWTTNQQSAPDPTMYTACNCRAGNLLISHLLIRSFCSNQMSDCERCSDRSRQMSDRERIDQVTQRKWATVSELLRLLKTNEQPWAIRSGR